MVTGATLVTHRVLWEQGSVTGATLATQSALWVQGWWPRGLALSGLLLSLVDPAARMPLEDLGMKPIGGFVCAPAASLPPYQKTEVAGW